MINNNNRQAGRRRGRNNNNNSPRQNGGGGGGNRGNGDSGNRIDNRARGNATQLLEKYRNLARDAQMAGDRVNAEYYFQFADHYFRVLADNRARQEEQQGGGGQQGRFRREDGDQDFDNDRDDMSDGLGDDGDDYASMPMQQEQRPPRREQPRDQGREQPRDQPRDQPREQPRDQERSRTRDRKPPQDRSDRSQERGPDHSEDRSQDRDDGRSQRFANDDDGDRDVEIGLPGLPPSIARIEISDEDDQPAEAETVVEVAPKPRRGRRPRAPEAAE